MHNPKQCTTGKQYTIKLVKMLFMLYTEWYGKGGITFKYDDLTACKTIFL